MSSVLERFKYRRLDVIAGGDLGNHMKKMILWSRKSCLTLGCRQHIGDVQIEIRLKRENESSNFA